MQGGELGSIMVGVPLDGANWDYTFPAFYEQEVRSLNCTLTAAAVAGNRVCIFELVDPAGALISRIAFTVATIISQVSVFSLFVGCSRSDYSLVIVGGNHLYNDTLPDMRLLPGCIIRSAFTGLNALDQFSGITMLVHRWRV
jgi:hypothetical protein